MGNALISAKFSAAVWAIAVAAALVAAGCGRESAGSASDCASPNPVNCPVPHSLNLDGTWRLAAFRASGNWSKGAEKDAGKVLGQKLRIRDRQVSLPDGSRCRIIAGGPTRVLDGEKEFGSARGSWQKLGFTPEADGSYIVEKAHFDCGGKFWGIVMQPEYGVHLLKIWEVYLLMDKTTG